MALAISEVRGIVERACARPDVLDACARHDLGTVITVLMSLGVTQGQIAELTGISQGRLSEWATGRRKPRATSTFESFADGLGLPPAARRALGLAPGVPAASGLALAHSLEAPRLDTGLEYPGTPTQATGNVSVLRQADLSDQHVAGRGLITPSAWNEASLRWLVAPAVIPATLVPHPAGSGSGRETWSGSATPWRCSRNWTTGTAAGTHEALIRYLQGDAVRLLRGRYPGTAGSALLAARMT